MPAAPKQAMANGSGVYASPEGSGTDCTQARPCSLLGARDKVRTVNADMTGDIAVLLADGVYNLSEPLEFVEEGSIHDSGSNGYIVSYQAAPGARPILSGGRRIVGWTMHDPSRSIYRAVVPATLKTRQLYVGGIRAIRARSRIDAPGYRKYSGASAARGFYNSEASTDVPDGSWRGPSRIEVVSRSVWKEHRCPVESAERKLRHWIATAQGDTFATPTDWPLDLGGDPLSHSAQRGTDLYRVGDFDGNGKSDLLMIGTCREGTRCTRVALSSGSTLAWSTPFQGPARGGATATCLVGDFDGDGKSDLLFAYEDEARTWHNEVALSNGVSFALESASDWMPDEGRGAAYHVGDFDGDKRSDLLLAQQDESGTWHNDVALSDGKGFHFTARRDWLPGFGKEQRGGTYHVGNFDGDARGASDLLVTYQDETGSWHGDVALSDGSSFRPAAPSDWMPDAGQGVLPAQFHVGNFDGDSNGTSDLLVSFLDSQGKSHHPIAFSNRHGFQLAQSPEDPLSVGQGLNLYVGDFDGDTSRRDDVLMGGAQTRLAIAEPCWMRTAADPAVPEVSWVENAYELLDTPGEWYLDEGAACTGPDTHCIYYIPRTGEDLASLPVIAPTLETLVHGHGDPSAAPEARYLHHLRFDGITFAFATWLAPSTAIGYPELQAGWHFDHAGKLERTPGNVTFSSVQSIEIRNGIFTHLGAAALNFDTGSQNVVVDGNVITDVSSSGIQLGDIDDYAADPSIGTAGNTISNNFVSKVAVEYESAVGIWIGYARDTRVRNNEVADLPYTGISLGWGWGQNSYAKNNQIVANSVHDVMRVLDDGGAIYTQSSQPGSSLLRNYLRGSGHVGIYHDDGSQHFTDRNNVVAETRWWLAAAALTVKFNEYSNNWTDYDHFVCAWGRDPHWGSNVLCSVNDNDSSDNWAFKSEPWPAQARAIIDAAGPERAYRTRTATTCGDATCSAEETAASCQKDCE